MDSRCPYTKFNNATLNRTSFTGAYIALSEFKKANLQDAQFYCTYVFRTNFKKANMLSIYAHVANFSFSNFTDADCHKGIFSSSTFNEINLRGTDLSNTDFSNAAVFPAYDNQYGNTLQYATLFKACLLNTKFRKNDINKKILHNAIDAHTIEIVDKEYLSIKIE
jgi:uncharacterized protein YjbI with pentapeptide repeats